jgi:hypothetical protein
MYHYSEREDKNVYVIATNFEIAGQLALDLMKSLGWKYTSYVSNIKMLACTNTHKADNMLAIE